MNLIASALIAIAQPFLQWALGFFSRKVIMVGTSLAAYVFITAALITCMNYIITNLLALAVLPSWVSLAVGMFLPWSFTTTLSAIIGAHSCRWAYDKAVEKIHLINGAT